MLWGYPASPYWEATVNPIGMIIGAVIMFGVLGFLPGWVIAKILNSMGKLRIPREVEIAGLDYEFAESARNDQHAVSALEKLQEASKKATVETWATEKISEYTAIYPFVGTEWVWLIVAVVFWLWWHVKTSAKENEEFDRIKSRGLDTNSYDEQKSDW